MRGMRRSVGAAALVIALSATSVRAETFTDPEGRFDITLPAGWVLEPPADTALRVSIADSHNPARKWRYVACFRHDSELTDEPLYVLVQWQDFPLRRVSWSELKRGYAQWQIRELVAPKSRRLEAFEVDVDLETPVLDRERARTVTRVSMTGLHGPMGEVSFEAVSVGFLGQDGVANLFCYAPQGTLERHLSKFDAVIDGFRYRAGEAYTGEGPGRDWSGAWTLLLLLAAAAVIGILLIIVALRMGVPLRRRGATWGGGRRSRAGRRARRR